MSFIFLERYAQAPTRSADAAPSVVFDAVSR